MRVGIEFFLWFAALLFVAGLYGALSKRSAVMILMSLELMANAVNVNLVAMSRFVTPKLMSGQFFAVFLMVVAASEIGLGLALVLALYRQTKTIEVEFLNELKG
jgi:NAD(P)H-quinone oxidoreductase subunit 4L